MTVLVKKTDVVTEDATFGITSLFGPGAVTLQFNSLQHVCVMVLSVTSVTSA